MTTSIPTVPHWPAVFEQALPYEAFLDRHLKSLAGIRRTQSLIALSSAKDSRVLPTASAMTTATTAGREAD